MGRSVIDTILLPLLYGIPLTVLISAHIKSGANATGEVYDSLDAPATMATRFRHSRDDPLHYAKQVIPNFRMTHTPLGCTPYACISTTCQQLDYSKYTCSLGHCCKYSGYSNNTSLTISHGYPLLPIYRYSRGKSALE